MILSWIDAANCDGVIWFVQSYDVDCRGIVFFIVTVISHILKKKIALLNNIIKRAIFFFII
jgi:hypothetical protein